MSQTESQVEDLLQARAKIDEQLRRHKTLITVLFTDVVGSTSYYDRFGDTAGLAMVHRHAELGRDVVRKFSGTVVKTIGDSIMAQFPDSKAAVHAAVEMQRRLYELNSDLPDPQRTKLRIGIHCGMGFTKGSDVYGDVVNVAARITKRTGAEQILISRTVHEALAGVTDVVCHWADKCTLDGRSEKEEIFEVSWMDTETGREARRKQTESRLANESASTRAELSSRPTLPARYEVLQKLGAGGIGIVYKARDLETNEFLAVKVLKPEIATDPVVQANFKNELCLARKITHKNVCRIYELNRNDGIVFASMEYIEGKNLLDLLNEQGKLPPKRALGIMKQICAGLGEAHAQGVVHRDLKPANVMVDAKGTVKVMDFGIARLMESDGGQTGTIVGTPAYMSPEQAEGKSVDCRTDVYALGLILYEMVTGIPAFSGDTPVAIALKQVRDIPPSPRELAPLLPQYIEAAIMKCLEKDAANRFQSVNEFEMSLVGAAEAVVPAVAQPVMPPAATIAAASVALPSEPSAVAAVARSEKAAVVQQQSAITNAPQQSSVQLRVAKAKLSWKMVAEFERDVESWIAAMVEVWRGSQARVQVRDILSKCSYNKLNPQQKIMARSGALVLVGFVLAYGVLRLQHGSPLAKAQQPASASSVSGNISGANATRPAGIGAGGATEAASLNPVGTLRSPNVGEQLADTASDDAVTPPARPKDAVARAPRSAAKAPPDKLKAVAAIAPVPEPALSSLPMTVVTTAPKLTASVPASAAPAAAIGPVGSRESVEQTAIPAGKYFEVGNFKELSWAQNAMDSLESFGFRVAILHKGRLWMNSYRVLVGPYESDEAAATASLELKSHGFNPHLSK